MVYDLIIIGAGPAGLTASIYASRHKMSHLVFDPGIPGGQIALATEVENWPGDKSVRGMELSTRMLDHAQLFGMKLAQSRVEEITRDDAQGCFCVSAGGEKHFARSLIIATGAMHRKLEVPGEEQFLGRGVSYCATCDGPFFRGKKVVVVGGGDSALTEAIYLADLASEVTIMHRRDSFRAEAANVEKAKSNPKIKFRMNSKLVEVKGDKFIKTIVVEDVNSKKTDELAADGVFIYVGNTPASALGKAIGVETDARSYIKVDAGMHTNVKGVFAAGDITGAALQAIVASGQGAIAAMNAYKFVKGIKEEAAVVNR